MHSAEKALWQEVIYTHEAMEQLYAQIASTCQYYLRATNEMDKYSADMVAATPKFDEAYPGLRAKLLKRLK